ncbi:MAG: UDP-N-acetylmuramate--L-alanine ligase [Anaerolinea sp.]|nr:UDP-N-acetylmuramate--L-alanine ligase [Anaerolinea sp.]
MTEITGPVHLVGIGGIHMSAIALLLLEKGVAVTGSDLRRSELTAKVERAGGGVFEGHAAANLGNPALVVTTAATNDENPEILEARKRGIPVILRAEMVARLMEGKRVIAVTGAHGKTTTSSLIAFILREAGRNPMYLLGGESIDLGGHVAWGGGDVCVVEADEYKRAFHEYRPQVAVITNVEPDHLDYYGTEAAYHEAFAHFASLVQPGGLLLVCADDPGSARLSSAARSARNQTYGTAAGSDWTATGIEKDAHGANFTVSAGRDVLGELHVPFPGDHFIRNALAATTVCLQEGVNFETIRVALAKVHGAHRRFETVGEARGILIMDDYAHHPAEVRSTVATARAAFPERRLIVVYQPHTYTRIAYLWDEWTRCWDGVDELIVLETYAAREQPLEGKSAKDLANAITGVPAHYAATFDDAAGQAVALAHSGDVIFTMGAGDVVEVGPKILERLS